MQNCKNCTHKKIWETARPRKVNHCISETNSPEVFLSESTLLGQSLTQKVWERKFSKEELFLERKTQIIVTRGQVKGYAPVCRPSNMREVEQFRSRRVKLRSLSARNTWLLWLPQRGVLQKTRPTIFGHDIFINVFFKSRIPRWKESSKVSLKE